MGFMEEDVFLLKQNNTVKLICKNSGIFTPSIRMHNLIMEDKLISGDDISS